MTNPPRVFISYARSDGEAFAVALRQRLEREEPEITLWQDRARMEGGKDWWRQITEALDAVQFMMLVMTPGALASPIVRQEWQYARQRGVCVYPVIGAPGLDFSAMPRWMASAHFYNLDKEWATFVNYLKSPCRAARVPFMARPLPDGFVERPGLLTPLRDALLDPQGLNPRPGLAALYGAGGYGKTTLALALCQRDEIITAYDAGIPWVTLGERPNVLAELTKLYAALTGERPGFVDKQDAAAALAARLDQGSYLLVIDDVWASHHLQPFLQGGPNCARLVTTRDFDIASTIANRVAVDEMSSDEAVQMLTARLAAPPPDKAPFRRLAARLGEWPLLLELARDVLHQRMARGEILEGALAYLETALQRKGVTAFDRRDAAQRNDAVARSLGVSLELLPPADQDRYRQLAIFPEDVEIPLTSVAALWGLDAFDTDQAVERLADLSLLHYDLPGGTVRLHDVIRSYLAGQLADPAAFHARLVEGWGDLHALPDRYAWRWAGYHLAGAGRHGTLRELLFDFRWLQARLANTEINALVADCERLLDPAAPSPEAEETAALQRLARTLRQAAHVLDAAPDQLAPQLLGRLLDHPAAPIRRLLAAARAQAPRPALLPRTPSLREEEGLVRTFAGHTGGVNAVAVTPDGRHAVSASHDHTLKLWDLASGKEVRTFAGHAGGVNAVAVTLDGRYAISGSTDNTLKLWELASGQEVRTFAGHKGGVNAVAVTPNGRYALSASDDYTLKLWELATGQELRPFAGHTGEVTVVTVTPDDRHVLSASVDDTLKLWELVSGQELRTFTGHTGGVTALAVTLDGRYAISASYDETLKLWELASGQELRTFTDHTGWVTAVAVTPDGRYILSASEDCTLKVWGLASGQEVRTFTGHTGWVNAVAVTPDGRYAISASYDETLKLWELTGGQDVRAFTDQTDWEVSAVAVTPDGRYVLSASNDGTLVIWNPASSREVDVLAGHTRGATAVAVTPDGHHAVSASYDKTFKLWELASGQEVRTFVGHTHWVTAVAVTPDGRHILSGSWDRTLRLWELNTGQSLRTFTGHRDWINAVEATPDGYYVISASADRTLKLWELASGQAVRTFSRHTSGVNAVAVTPDGRYAISASSDTLKLWELATGQEMCAFAGHTGGITALAVTPDGRYAISASADRTLKLWELANGLCLATFHADGPLRACAVAPDGRTVVAGGASGRLHFLRLER